MTAVKVVQTEMPGIKEADSLARELADAYRSRVSRYKHQLGLETTEAVAKAEEPCSIGRRFTILGLPPEVVTWSDLQELAQTAPDLVEARLTEIKQAAMDELRSGYWAGGVLQDQQPRPYQMARFLALREELGRDWGPRNGIERQLVDM